MPPLRAYAFDILGSLAGIAAFTLMSFAWRRAGRLAVVVALITLLGLARGLTAWSFVSAAALIGCVFVARRVNRPVVAIPAADPVGGGRVGDRHANGCRTRGSR